MYVQSCRTDDGGFATRGLAPLGDSAAVMPGSEFVADPPTIRRPTDVAPIRRGSMTSVHGVFAIQHTDTQSRAAVHALSIPRGLAPQADITEVSA